MASRTKNISYYLSSFLLPFIIVISVFAFLKITPFGNQNFLLSDIGAQYIPFLTNFRHDLLTGNFSFYSFNLSLGDNIFPLMAYYLLSPFNLILLLFPANSVPTALTWIIILKIATIGLTTAWFFKQTYKNNDLINLVFSTSFALCGFVAMYFYDLMWLDALILLPLVTIGIRRLFYEQKTLLYTFSLLAAIITNYYLGYMTCLYSVFYFIYLLILNKQFKSKKHSIIQFAVSSILSGAMSSVILLPTALGMMQTAKQTLRVKNFLPLPSFGASVFAQFGVIGSNFTQRISHDPSIFMSSILLILFISFFLNSKISKQKKIASSFLVVSLILGMYVTTFNTIWHMFQHPAGFPFRNVFFFTFIAINLAYESWSNKPSKSNLIISSLIAAILITIGYIFAARNGDFVSSKYYLYDLLFLILSICGLLLTEVIPNGKILILAIVSMELGFNFIGSLSGAPLGDQNSYAKNYNIENKWFKKTNASSNDFYRVDNSQSLINKAYDLPYNNYNDSLLFNVHSTDLYSSTLNNNTRLMLKNLGYYSKNVRRIGAVGNTEITDVLFNMKYKLSMTTHDYDLTKLKTMGIGFSANKAINNVKLQNNHPIVNQTKIWNAITDQKAKYFGDVSMKSSSIDSTHYSLKINKSRYPLYIVPTKKETLSVNDNIVTVHPHTIVNLGKNKDFEIDLKKSSSLKTLEGQFKFLNTDKVSQSMNGLTEFKLNKNWNSYHISGIIDIKNNSSVAYISIPYDGGWQATVNGKQVHVNKVAGNMISLPVTKGTNKINMTYHVPGLAKGLQLSLLSFVVYAMLFFINRFTERRNQK
ncbi:YfhO family protein [Companilactobacillus jidongensis]|uniref:YfhO family protein n=1 Tax=Companilactobacillus jidongensis TaxID=2486006 RepID=UPI000F7A7530|nr:YfhO family protein [Companilactobacillus jidongensis]